MRAILRRPAVISPQRRITLGYMGVIIGEHAHERKTTLVLNATSDFLQRAGGAGTVLTIAEAGSSQGTKLNFSHVYITEE